MFNAERERERERVYFPFFLLPSEVWSADDVALLAPYITYEFDTRSDPKPAAGTTWTFYWYHQYLYAADPITEPVVIKVTNFVTKKP